MFVENTQSTIMSVLFGAAGQDANYRNECLQRFCQTYTTPLVRFLVATKKIDPDEAREIVQDFWLVKILQPAADKNLIAKYLDARDKNSVSGFRRYLARSVSNHFINRQRTAEAAYQRAVVSIDAMEGWEPSIEADAIEFDLVWANHLFKQVLEAVRQECDENGHHEKWQIFVRLILRPSFHGLPRPSYSELAQEMSIADPKSVGNAWVTVKRMLDRHFFQAVQDYLPARTPEQSSIDANREVRELLFRLSSVGGLRLSSSIAGLEPSHHFAEASLTIESCSLSALFQSKADLRSVWQAVRQVNLINAFDLQDRSESKFLTIKDLIEGTELQPGDLNLLRSRCKQLGKSRDDELTNVLFLPRDILRLVYLLAIISAKLHLSTLISGTSVDQLRRRSEKYVDAAWLDDATRAFCQRFVQNNNQANSSG